MVTPQKVKTEYWVEKEFSEVQERTNEQEIGELYSSIVELEQDHEAAHALARSFHDEKEELYDDSWGSVREVAKEEIEKEYQPDWAWSFLSQEPEELDEELLEIPSGGENKGMLVDRKNDEHSRIFLYPKKTNGISGKDHVERWSLNIDNDESFGYKFPAESHERVALSFNENGEEIVVEGMEMDYNSEMVLSSDLISYFKQNVDEEEAGNYSSEFRSRWVEDLAGREPLESYVEEWSSEEQENVEEESWIRRWADTSSPGSQYRIDKWVESQASERDIEPERVRDGDLEFLIDEGYFVCTGVSDFKYATGNIAFMMPDNPENMKPEELYDASELLIVDAGEYETDEEGPDIEQNLDEDPFVDESRIEVDGGEEFDRPDVEPQEISIV